MQPFRANTVKGGNMMSKHTLKLFAAIVAFVAVIAAVWSTSAPVDRWVRPLRPSIA
jgi:hypothetical protein